MIPLDEENQLNIGINFHKMNSNQDKIYDVFYNNIANKENNDNDNIEKLFRNI